MAVILLHILDLLVRFPIRAPLLAHCQLTTKVRCCSMQFIFDTVISLFIHNLVSCTNIMPKITFWSTVGQICIFLVLNDYLGNKPTLPEVLLLEDITLSCKCHEGMEDSILVISFGYLLATFACWKGHYLYCRPRRGPESGYRRQRWWTVLAFYFALDLNRPQQTFQTLSLVWACYLALATTAAFLFQHFDATVHDNDNRQRNRETSLSTHVVG